TSLVVPIDAHIALTGGPSPSTFDVLGGVAFWIAITLLASAIPIRLPGGTLVALSTAPIIVAMNLGGPTVAAWGALLGSTEAREIRGRIPWYGTLANHAGIALPAIVGGWLMSAVHAPNNEVLVDCLRTILGAAAFYVLNNLLASSVAALRTGQSVGSVLFGEIQTIATNFLALAPMAW